MGGGRWELCGLAEPRRGKSRESPSYCRKGRLRLCSRCPTFEKVGYDSEMSSFVIIFAPKGIPDFVREILGKAFVDGMKTETFKTVATNQGLLIADPLAGKDLHDYLSKWNALYEEFIKEEGIYKIERK